MVGRLKTPRLTSGSPKSIPLGEYVDNDRDIAKQEWARWHLKDTQKGAKVVDVKHAIVYPQNAQKLPSKAHHLLIVRDVLSNEVKLFLANAPKSTKVETLLKIAFSRWRVERCFEDDKKYIGLDHFEGRGYPGLMRHLILSAVLLLFLARERQALLGEYPELTVSQVRQAASATVQSWWLPPKAAEKLINDTAYKLEYHQKRNRERSAKSVVGSVFRSQPRVKPVRFNDRKKLVLCADFRATASEIQWSLMRSRVGTHLSFR